MTYETVIDKATKQEYEVLCDKAGENPQKCPSCSDNRKKQNQNKKSFSYNSQTGLGYCQNCDLRCYRKVEDYKVYVRPALKTNSKYSEKLIEWFQKRQITIATLEKMRVTEATEWMPQTQKDMNVICFNYYRNGELINTKFRDAAKNFKLVKDAEKIFYNLDGIKDKSTVYIVEGEIDCLTMVQCGYENTVSVPNGATKTSNKLDYLDRCYSYFENVQEVFICTDHDEPGEMLGNELARRIGVEKCFRVHLNGFKDVNEQLSGLGKVDVSDYKAYPITGIYSVDDHWEGLLNILKHGYPKGWKPRGALGDLVSFHPGYMTIITGIPGHGKSELLDQILLQITIDYNLRGGYFTPENWPTEVHLIKIVEKLMGKSAFKLNESERNKSKSFLNDRVYWVYPEEGYSLETILDKMRQAVLKYGIQWFVIDPWNKLEHHDDSTGYVSRCLDSISNFNKKNGTHSFVVAHPTKMKMNHDTSKYDVPGLYDISGSANFYNKADVGLCVYKEEQNVSTLIVQKVKFKFWGQVGQINLTWNPENGRYDEYGQDLTYWLKDKQETRLIDFSEPRFENDEVPF